MSMEEAILEKDRFLTRRKEDPPKELLERWCSALVVVVPMEKTITVVGNLIITFITLILNKSLERMYVHSKDIDHNYLEMRPNTSSWIRIEDRRHR